MTPPRIRAIILVLLAGASVAWRAPAFAQGARAADSALVARILLAEDRRDSLNAVFEEAARSRDERIRLLARRAAERIRDPRFSSRDSFPAPAAVPSYPDPAWRLRLRSLQQNASCATLANALADSAWPVRFRAMSLIQPICASDATILSALRTWASSPPSSTRRRPGEASWHPAAHALVALARIAPADARTALPRIATSPIPFLRTYAARAAGTLSDTATLRRLAADPNDNVKEAAIVALSRVAAHAGDGEYIAAFAADGYQAVRVAANALAGSPRGSDVATAAIAAARRLRADSSETSRDARMAVLERIEEFATAAHAGDVTALATDFDCAVARQAAEIASRLASRAVEPRCTPLPITLPRDAVALALGQEVRIRVTMADSSGGGGFTIRLRGDVAPIMAARVLALVRDGYYDGLVWQRVEHDFVLQGGGPGANEYVGHPRFIRDELGAIAHPRGSIGMSTRGHDTGDAQWFVNLRDNPRLVRDYSIFAEVIEGIDVVDGVLEGDVIARMEVRN